MKKSNKLSDTSCAYHMQYISSETAGEKFDLKFPKKIQSIKMRGRCSNVRVFDDDVIGSRDDFDMTMSEELLDNDLKNDVDAVSLSFSKTAPLENKGMKQCLVLLYPKDQYDGTPATFTVDRCPGKANCPAKTFQTVGKFESMRLSEACANVQLKNADMLIETKMSQTKYGLCVAKCTTKEGLCRAQPWKSGAECDADNRRCDADCNSKRTKVAKHGSDLKRTKTMSDPKVDDRFAEGRNSIVVTSYGQQSVSMGTDGHS